MSRPAGARAVSFGIATAPQQVSYADIQRVWREADTVRQIDHAWLFDHLLPIGGDQNGPIFEGWTLLTALAAQTQRLRLGLMVTSNRIRPPALLAKIATTVDVVCDGRLDFGIGVGSRPAAPGATREYAAHGLPYVPFAQAVDSLAEACTVIRSLWTQDAPFDFEGTHVQLREAFGNPKPVQQPHPPILIAGRTRATLRVVAQHADVWNIPGGDLDDCIASAAVGHVVRSMSRTGSPRRSSPHPDESRARLARPLRSANVAGALDDLTLLDSGKVREIYEVEGDRLLLVASDRVSTYDAVHPTQIPGKGAVLTGLSAFWFKRTSELVPNHVVSVADGVPDEVRGRAMVVRRLSMLPVECVVRGYLSGSGWKDYQVTGAVSGIRLPSGLSESDRLPEPIFTPSTKAAAGHDEAIDLDTAAQLIGDADLARRVGEISIAVYRQAAEHAAAHGIILADTKFEFGLGGDGTLTIGDEMCTPDSSRFWPADTYEPGHSQPSFDKQFVRDWATSTGWDRLPPAPAIPDEIVAATQAKYADAYARIAAEPLSAWLSRTGAVA